jgi:hypothetical protein
MSDDDLQTMTGRTHEEVDCILEDAHGTGCPHLKTELCTYLLRLHSGCSQQFIACLLHVNQSTVSRYIRKARQKIRQFTEDAMTFTRDKIIANTTGAAWLICGVPHAMQHKPVITVWDSTSLYHQKSSNLEHQEATYSGEKKQYLQKVMIICTTNGTVIHVGENAYGANKSDANIMRHIMKGQWFKGLFRKEDIFVLDRGFQGVREFLVQQGYHVIMPSIVHHEQQQFTFEEANDSRIASMIRWIVEAAIGALKRYKFFHQTICNMNTIHMIEDLRFIAACGIKFDDCLHSEEQDDMAAEQMLTRSRNPNLLQTFVNEEHLLKRKICFKKISEVNPVIIQLNQDQLKYFGANFVHQQAIALYARQGWRENHASGIEVAVIQDDYALSPILKKSDLQNYGLMAEDPILVRACMNQKFVTGKSHIAFVLFDAKASAWNESIVAHYCTCKIGARTTDCCPHTNCLIWFLAHAEHQQEVRIPGSRMEEHLPNLLEDASMSDVSSDVV